jgi:hypothetical protein
LRILNETPDEEGELTGVVEWSEMVVVEKGMGRNEALRVQALSSY